MTALVLALAAAALLVLRRRRRVAAVDPRRELASVAMHLSRATRAGMTPLEGLHRAAERTQGPVGAELAEVCGRMQRGESLDEALGAWGLPGPDGWRHGVRRRDRPDADDVELVVAAARFAQQQGRGLPEVFEAVTATLVDRAEVADEVRALTSQSFASIAVLCALPVLGATMAGALFPQALEVLFATPVGWACLMVAMTLDASAVAVSLRLTRRVTR